MIPERTHSPGRRILAATSAVVLAACLCACGSGSGETPRAGAAGEIDTAFGEGGIRRLSYPAYADDVRLDSQGRVLLASHYGLPLSEALFTRVFADGGFDPTLFRRVHVVTAPPYDSAVIPLADDRFIGVIEERGFYPGPGAVVRVEFGRFDAGGVPDANYGSAGVAFFATRQVHDLIGAADGSVVVLGMMTPLASVTGAAEIARLDPAGERVPDYESRAQDAVAACGGSVNGGYRGALQPDGRLVLAIAQLAPGTGGYRLCVARLNADGGPDTHFGSGGSLSISPPPAVASSHPSQVRVRPDGGIVVLFSYLTDVEFSPYRTAILWLTKDGRVDTSRGTAGISLFDDSVMGEAVDAAIQADGKLLLVGHPLKATAGSPYLLPDSTGPRIVRLDDVGRIDPAFGPTGDGIVPLEAGGNRLLPTRVVASGVGTVYVAGGAVPVGPANDLAYLALSVMKLFTGER